MRRGSRSRKATYARAVCAACLVGSLTACSNSGDKPTLSSKTTPSTSTTTVPPTTLPTAASVTAVKAWFAAHGEPLLQFERVTDDLATGKVPQAAACLKFLRTDLPRITNDQNKLVRLSGQIPNPYLSLVVTHDLAQKLLVGRGCGTAALRHQTIAAGTPEAWASVRNYSVDAHLWLSRFGISI